jgi:hypothetical protein
VNKAWHHFFENLHIGKVLGSSSKTVQLPAIHKKNTNAEITFWKLVIIVISF